MPPCIRRGVEGVPIWRTSVAEIPVTTRHWWIRSRAEAAVLEAKGDVDGAMNKLAETETALLALPENAQRETLLRLLRGWKADLCRR
jgi:hypothetical protein